MYRVYKEYRDDFQIEIGNLFNIISFDVIWIWFAAKEFKEQKMKININFFYLFTFLEKKDCFTQLKDK